MSDRPTNLNTVVCPHCRVGILLFVQRGIVKDPNAKVYECTYCKAMVTT